MKNNLAMFLCAVVFVAFTVCILPIDAINCYQCSRNPGCGSPFNPSSAVSISGCDSCGTFITTIRGIKYYDRDCAPDYLNLYLVGVDAVFGTKCLTDRCNTYTSNETIANGSTFWTLLTSLFWAKMPLWICAWTFQKRNQILILKILQLGRETIVFIYSKILFTMMMKYNTCSMWRDSCLSL